MTSFISPIIDEAPTRTTSSSFQRWIPLRLSFLAKLCQESYSAPVDRYQQGFDIRLLASGTREMVYQVGPYRIFVFRGTQVTDVSDLLTDAQLVLGTTGSSERVHLSLNFVRQWSNGILPENIYLIGHSLGGYIAYILATDLGYNSISLNPGSSPLVKSQNVRPSESAAVENISKALGLHQLGLGKFISSVTASLNKSKGSDRNIICLIPNDFISQNASTWVGNIRYFPQVSESPHSLSNFLNVQETMN
jgi:hypothetical protein